MIPYKITVAQQSLARICDHLSLILSKRQEAADIIASQTNQLRRLESANPEYTEQLADRRETMLAYWRLILVILAALIDLFISIQAMEIICQKFGLSPRWKYVMPFALVLLETGISYSHSIRQREGKLSSWLANKLPYTVLILLVGLTALVIVFEINSYNPSIDGINFTTFIITTVFVQVTLLCASILMHIWIINHAAQIGESFSYLKFRKDHSSLERDIARMQNTTPTFNRIFLSHTQNFVRELQSFKRQYPTEAHDLTQTIPASIKNEMEQVMGYNIFSKRHY